jgi:SAM-dependent methyltransferase
VDEFHSRLSIVGVDPNYSSAHVTTGSLSSLPFDAASFDRALCLDVLEHLPFPEQGPALAELFRVVRPGGEVLVSVPNLAHLQSRIHFLLGGRLIHTASLAKHPGDRPWRSSLIWRRAPGFDSCSVKASSPLCPSSPMDPAIARASGVAASAADAGLAIPRTVFSQSPALRAPVIGRKAPSPCANP